jgi:hypothetical protein
MDPNMSMEIDEESDSEDGVDQFIWNFMNDPVEAQIRAQIQGTSIQHRRFHRRYIERGRGAARDRLMSDYFSENPVYNDFQF